MPPRPRSLVFYQAPLSPSLSPSLIFEPSSARPSFVFADYLADCQPIVSRFPPFSPFLLIFSISVPVRLIFVKQTPKIRLFLKKISEKFGGFRKKQYFCTRFQENGNKHYLKQS